MDEIQMRLRMKTEKWSKWNNQKTENRVKWTQETDCMATHIGDLAETVFNDQIEYGQNVGNLFGFIRIHFLFFLIVKKCKQTRSIMRG